VISPLEGSPAKRAGVEAGDAITAIDGESTEDVSVQEAVQKIRGETGTDVTITVLSEEAKETEDITIKRENIELPTMETQVIDDTFVISLYNFSAKSTQAFQEALKEFKQSDAKRLMVDLRGNTGGFLQAAVTISSHFLEEGKVIVREDFGGNQDNEVYRSKGFGTVEADTDVGILVNGGTASASEIVAGALRDHGVANLYGTQTFGKGSVQELVELPQDSALKITVARWMTPEDVSISEGGLTPETEITIPENREDKTNDELSNQQLRRAVEAFTN
jgi:carboxyl-terminal processing protease